MADIVYYGTEGPDEISWMKNYGPNQGPDFKHEFHGLGGNDTIDGGYNTDQLFGGGGDDIIRGDHIGNIVVPAGFSQADTIGGGQGNDQLFGQLGNDVIHGGSGGDYLDGGDGDDVLYADYDTGVFADGLDTLRGGNGNDVYIVHDANCTFVVNDPGRDRLETSVSVAIAGFQIEDVTLLGTAVEANGNAYNNVLRGNGVGNVLRGLAGSDTLYGFGGNDQLDGGLGLDTLYGSTGDDTYYVNALYDTVLEFDSEGFDRVIATTSYSLETAGYIEELILSDGAGNGTGNDLDNRIVGNGAANILDGRKGADVLEGGGGNDTYILNDVYAKYFRGEPIGDYYDTVTEAADGGIDTIHVSRQPGITLSWLDNTYYELDPNIENGRVIGTGAFDLTGNELANRLYGNGDANVLEGGNGNDYLDGYLGADTLIGGAGNDTYALNDVYGTRFGDFYDTVQESAGGGIDTILVSRQPSATFPGLYITDYGLGANIENGTIIGAGEFDLTGNELANRLIGNGDANLLEGGTGNDFLDGGLGIDTLVGGADNDTYVLNDVNAWYFNGEPLGDFFDTVQENAGGGIDTVRVGRQPGVTRARDISSYVLGETIENGVVIGTGAFDLDGNDSDNRLTGNGAANILWGLNGDDVLMGGGGADFLRGGAGVDTMNGGLGIDSFIYAFLSDSGVGVGNRDVIQGFVSGQDRINVATLDANQALAGNQAFILEDADGIFEVREIRQQVVSGSLVVSFNVDADTTAEMQIFVSGRTTPLGAADFVL
jgi:Ca2+-binding RTX toxin-like protein